MLGTPKALSTKLKLCSKNLRDNQSL